MNKNFKSRLIGITFSTISIVGFAQPSKIENVNFRPPVDIPLYLSGTFGELRSDHFHSGIDIKTQGDEGKVIRAIADGWVSRIKISIDGYGKAIYITHPTGYVSVYGHLQKFNDSIQKFVINEQYKKESFDIQIFPKTDQIKVKQGDIIAYSGNTGSSDGPHLHFEIRDEKSEYPLNPLLFKDIKVKDFYRPKITELVIYPVDSNSTINGVCDTVLFDIDGWGIEHRIKGKPEITVFGRISFGICTYDLMNDLSNKNGVYNTKLFHDTAIVFDLKMNKLSFNTTRYVNSLIDYSYFIKSKKRVIRTEIDTNNLFKGYVTVHNNGIINFKDTLIHSMAFGVADAYDNKSRLEFKVRSSDNKSKVLETKLKKINRAGTFFNCTKQNMIIKDSVMATFPANSFYRSFYFDFDVEEKDTNSFSRTYKLHNRFTPVHKNFNIKIFADSVTSGLSNKVYISYSPDNSEFQYMKTKHDGNYLTSKSRQLGYYKVMLDTTPPLITEINFHNGKKINNQHNLKIKIEDTQTGISEYRARLNDKWVLMEYDKKNNLLTYNFDERLLKGKNEFKLIVIDMLDNVSEYNCELIY